MNDTNRSGARRIPISKAESLSNLSDPGKKSPDFIKATEKRPGDG
jgi:hypothetical protein